MIPGIKLLADKSFFRLTNQTTPSIIACYRQLEYDGKKEIIGIDAPIPYPGRNYYRASRCNSLGYWGNSPNWKAVLVNDDIFGEVVEAETLTTPSGYLFQPPFTYPRKEIIGKKVTYYVAAKELSEGGGWVCAVSGLGVAMTNLVFDSKIHIENGWYLYVITRPITSDTRPEYGQTLFTGIYGLTGIWRFAYVMMSVDDVYTSNEWRPAPEDTIVLLNGNTYVQGTPIKTIHLKENQLWTLWNTSSEKIGSTVTECVSDVAPPPVKRLSINHTINYDNLVRQQLPVSKRLPKREMFCRTLISPLAKLFSEFSEWRTAIRLERNITGQKGVLQGYLRTKHKSESINIIGIYDSGVPVGLPFEGVLTAASIGLPGEPTQEIPLCGEIRGEFGDVDFVVYVPADFTNAQIESIKIDIERYKQVLAVYKIVK